METRRFDSAKGVTLPMRSKEQVFDYRFLAEPDLPPIRLREEELAAIGATLPEFPAQRAERLQKMYGLTADDAAALTSDPALADFYELGVCTTNYPKLLCNLILSELLRVTASDPFVSPVAPAQLGLLAQMMGEGILNSSTAKKLLLRLVEHDLDLRETVAREQLAQIRDPAVLGEVIDTVIRENTRAVTDYQNGKTAALRALQGQVMARTQGRADPLLAEKLLLAALHQ